MWWFSMSRLFSCSFFIKRKRNRRKERCSLVAKKTPFVFLENVDRLTKSPAKQRGRDFGIMLKCLDDLGYAVEWRIINAADYGFPQRRRRTYIFAYRKGTNFYKLIIKNSADKIK